MKLIDSHTHIDFPDFNEDLDSVINNAYTNGVEHIVVSATTAKHWPIIENLVKNKKNCHAAYGLHPMFMAEYQPSQINELRNLIVSNKPIAIGEIGLDFFIPFNNEELEKKRQLEVFISQLELANEFNLPVIIHSRKSLDIVLKHLRKMPNLKGSIHSFSGSLQQAKQLINLGFYLGFGGPITYTRATRLRSLVSQLPLDSILLETDSPDQPDSSHYNERNEPSYLPIIAQCIADLHGVDTQHITQVTTKNAKTLFNFNEES